MSCPAVKTLKQFMEAQGNTMGLNVECSKRPGLFSMVLKHIWPSIYFLPGIVRHYQLVIGDTSFTLPNSERLYAIEGFYAQGCACSECAEKQYNTCKSGSCECTAGDGCADGYRRINMTEMRAVPEIFPGQYNVPCIGSTTVSYQLPECATKAYVRYFVLYPDLVDENSSLGIPEYLEPALQAILKYYTINNGGTEQGDDARFKEDFNAFVAQQIAIFAPNAPRDLAVRLAP